MVVTGYTGIRGSQVQSHNKEAGHEKGSIEIVGMDVHKNSISMALAKTDGSNEAGHLGKIGGTTKAPDTFVRSLVSQDIKPLFVYEAGPWGFEIYRHLTEERLFLQGRGPLPHTKEVRGGRGDVGTGTRTG